MIHHVFANRANVGDWLSARGIQSLLGGLPLREHLCDEPFVPDTLERLAATGSEDVVVVGGGGLFMDYFDPFWRGLLDVAPAASLFLWGLGYVDLKLEPSRPPAALLEAVVRRSRLCVVRDELTRRHLAACELPPSIPCPSLLAVEPAPSAGRGVLHAANYTTVGAEAYEAMRAHGEAYARATGRIYRETDNTIPVAGDERALASVLALYAASDVVVSSRLHGCVLAVALGRRVVAVSGDHKIESFMEAAGLADWVCGQDDLDTLPDRLSGLAGQPVRAAFVADARSRHREVAGIVRAAALEPIAPARPC